MNNADGTVVHHTRTHTHTHTHKHTHTHARTHTYTYTHTRTHTHILSPQINLIFPASRFKTATSRINLSEDFVGHHLFCFESIIYFVVKDFLQTGQLGNRHNSLEHNGEEYIFPLIWFSIRFIDILPQGAWFIVSTRGGKCFRSFH